MNETKKLIEEKFYIAESAMLPSGAWAKTVGYYDDEFIARAAFRTHVYQGPSGGIISGRELHLMRRRIYEITADGDRITDRRHLMMRRYDSLGLPTSYTEESQR